jgi:hypothetical protein
MIGNEDKAIVSFTPEHQIRMIHWRDYVPWLLGIRKFLESVSKVAVIYVITLASIALWDKLCFLGVRPWGQRSVSFIVHVLIKIALDVIIVQNGIILMSIVNLCFERKDFVTQKLIGACLRWLSLVTSAVQIWTQFRGCWVFGSFSDDSICAAFGVCLRSI